MYFLQHIFKGVNLSSKRKETTQKRDGWKRLKRYKDCWYVHEGCMKLYQVKL